MQEVGCGIVEHTLEELEMHKVCAHWVSCKLVLEIREQRVVAAQTFLTRFEKDKNELLEWVVTGNESWIH